MVTYLLGTKVRSWTILRIKARAYILTRMPIRRPWAMLPQDSGEALVLGGSLGVTARSCESLSV